MPSQMVTMRLLRGSIWAMVVCVAMACTPQSQPVIEGVSIEAIGQSRPNDAPERVMVRAEIDNPTYAVKLCEGRARISYKGRNVVVLSLEKRVRVAARRRQTVELELRVSVARNTQVVAFREALRRGDVGEMAIEWQIDARVAGVKHYEIVHSSEPLAEILSQEQIEELSRQFAAEPEATEQGDR